MLDPWDGQAGARDYRFDAHLIARGLVKLAQGASYKDASHAARREQAGPSAMGGISQNAQLAANWTESFAHIVTAPTRPTKWPDVVVLDSKEFQRRHRSTGSWHVLAATGRQTHEQALRPWALTATPSSRQTDWESFLLQMEGEPRIVISDMANEIGAAIRKIWPNTLHYLCEFHVQRKLSNDMSVLDDADPLKTDSLKRAFYTPATWAEFKDAVTTHDRWHRLGPVRDFIRTKGPQVEEGLRERELRDPKSNATVEALLRQVENVFPSQRACRMGNLHRTNQLLRLVLAAQRHEADDTAWAVHIRKHLESVGGHAPRQRQHDDPAGTASLPLIRRPHP